MKRTAVLRVDASARVGLGHVVRSLTLGEALIGFGWNVVLVTTQVLEAIVVRANAASIEVRELVCPPFGEHDAATVLSIQPDLVVADGYRFESAFYASFVGVHPLLCVIDDNAETTRENARIVVNPNPSANDELYGGPSAERSLLLGLQYALVRREMVSVRAELTVERGFGVFVSMGGSDPRGLGELLAKDFSRAGMKTFIALGPAMDNRTAVLDRLRRLPDVDVVTDQGFAKALASASVAVIGAGTTMWEAAFLGVPSVSVVLADNQSAPAAAAASLGFTVALDARNAASRTPIEKATRELLADPTRRALMTQLGRLEVDGRGASRVARFLSEFAIAEGATLC